ncbi:MAG: lipid-A-disaccharide synthase-related protein [Pseudomonadota bacterium]
MAGRILCISGGHGEDNHAAHVIRALRERDPSLEFGAIPIVGLGRDYQKIDVPIVAPTKQMPSGGFVYMEAKMLRADIRAGLIGLSIRQFAAMRRVAPRYDAVFAVGDHVPQFSAYLSGRPFVSFISCVSALYTKAFEPNRLLRTAFKSPRCYAALSRDPHTADVLKAQGFANAGFGGMPTIDFLKPGAVDLALRPGVPMVALLPGSRVPEAFRNLKILMDFAEFATEAMGGDRIQFRAALVPKVRAGLGALADSNGWTWDGRALVKGAAEIPCPEDAFADIAHSCDVTVGLAGLALEQIVALGKPAIQFPGEGPQFTPRFARAQETLLGLSVRTVGQTPPDRSGLEAGAKLLAETLADEDYLAECRRSAETRFAAKGASGRLADAVLGAMGTGIKSEHPGIA